MTQDRRRRSAKRISTLIWVTPDTIRCIRLNAADPTVALNLVPLLGHSDDAVRQAAAEAIESLEE